MRKVWIYFVMYEFIILCQKHVCKEHLWLHRNGQWCTALKKLYWQWLCTLWLPKHMQRLAVVEFWWDQCTYISSVKIPTNLVMFTVQNWYVKNPGNLRGICHWITANLAVRKVAVYWPGLDVDNGLDAIFAVYSSSFMWHSSWNWRISRWDRQSIWSPSDC